MNTSVSTALPLPQGRPSADTTAAPTAAATPGGSPPLWMVALTFAALLLAVLLGISNLRTPSPAPADQPLDKFSSVRVMPHLQRIAAEPHPTGTEANAKVRAYLVEQLKALGLETQVQSEFGVLALPQASVGGQVHNVVARLKGRAATGKALMLAAHYDSVPTGPGAADDGASVAAILETLRAIKLGQPLQNDVIVLLSDGEEIGMLGAEAFSSKHPWARDVGVVLNFEYRGNSGPMLMFETSSGNGKLIQALARTQNPVGNSLMHEIYKRMPNSTDMSAFKAGGLMGLNFAALERPTAYHNELDRWDLVNQGSVQHQGELMLALTRYFGNADIANLKGRDSVYFDVPGLGLLHYPAPLAMPLAALTLLLLACTVVLAVRRSALRWGRTLLAMLVFPVLAALAAALASGVWMAVCAVHPQYQSLMDTYNAHWYALAFVGLTLGLALPLQRLVQRWFTATELALGAMSAWTLLMALTSVTMPGASYVFTWPLLPVLAAQCWQLSTRGQAASTGLRLSVWAAAGALVLLLVAPVVHILFIAVTMNLAFVVVLLMMLTAGLLLPLLNLLKHRWMLPSLPLLGGVAALVVGSLTAEVSAESPHPTNLFYAQLPGSSQAVWLSTDERLDAWQRSVLGDKPERRKAPELFGDRPRTYWVAPAPALNLAAPTLTVHSDQVVNGQRVIEMQVQSPRQAPQIKLFAEGVKVSQASLQGRAVTTKPQSDWAAAAHALPDAGARLVMTVEPGRAFVLRAVDRSYGLPATLVKPRDDHNVSQHLGASDTLQAVSVLNFAAQP